MTAYIHKPTITSDSSLFATEGASFSLTCHAEVSNDLPYTIVFLLPNGQAATEQNFVIVSNLEHEDGNRRKSHVNLTIPNSVESRDKGDYKCTVMDLYNNTNSADVTITFIGEAKVEFQLTNPTITTSKGKKQAQFLIDYIAYPKAFFEWYDPHKNMIVNNYDVLNREKYDIDISKDQIKFRIKFPGIEDYGEYTLVAYSGGQNFTQKVSLIVSGKKFTGLLESFLSYIFFFQIKRKTNL